MRKKQTINKIDFSKKFYTIEEIANLVNKAYSTVYILMNNKGFKPAFKKVLKTGGNEFYFKNTDVYKFINLAIYIPVVEKVKKPYFEFSELIIESKLNHNGLD